MSDSEKVRPVTRREFWWVFGGLSGAFLFLAQIGVMVWGGRGECDVILGGRGECDVILGGRGECDVILGGREFVLLGVTVAGYLALVAAAAWLESRYAVREEERS